MFIIPIKFTYKMIFTHCFFKVCFCGGYVMEPCRFINPSTYIYQHCFTGSTTLHWRHNDHGGVSNHQPHSCLLNPLFRRRSKKISKLRVTGLCVGNSPGPVNSPHKGPGYAENVSIWWRHHELPECKLINKLNPLFLRQNARHFADDISKCISLGWSWFIVIRI